MAMDGARTDEPMHLEVAQLKGATDSQADVH